MQSKSWMMVLLALLLVGALGASAQEAGVCNVAAPEESVEINFIGWSFPIADYIAGEVEGCGAVDNITVNVSFLSSSDVLEQVPLALSAGGDSPYDILHGSNGQVGGWGAQGWLLPLTDLVEKYWDEYNLGDIPDAVWDGGRLDGEIYGIPTSGNTLHLFYRSDVLAEMGFEVPSTYDEILAFCDAVGLDNMDWDAPFGIDLSRPRGWELEFFMVLGAYGGTYLGEGNQPTFNGPEGLAAVQLMLEVYNRCLGDAASLLSNNGMETGMQQGTIPMVKLWASRAAFMTSEFTDLSDVITFAPAPAAVEGGPLASSIWNDFYFIPANTTNDPDLLFRIIMEALDVESQAAAALLGIPARSSAAVFGGPYLPASNATAAGGVGNYAKNPAVNIVIAKLSDFLPLTATGEMSPQEALDAAAAAYVEEATAQGYIASE